MSDYNFKYRPQKIAELDLASIRERLSSVLQSGKIPHAFLFAGPKGTGKTSAARIIAKAVNCVGKDKKDFEPCGKCEQCLSITAGNNLDVLEIDAASNRGIDDIRDLREKIKLAPTVSKYKVYIIDEAHMLTIEAFNALLKTLEEPPEHAIFILCTTAPEKLPETIISRCMRFNFKQASPAEIASKLKKIAQEEKIELDQQALEEIAKAVAGSFRDALRVLEQASFTGEKITAQLVREVLGYTAGLRPQSLLELLVEKDTPGSLGEISRVVTLGGNLRVYTEQILEILRAGLLSKLGVSETGVEEIEETKVLFEKLNLEQIKQLIEIFSKAALQLKEAVIPQLPLELAAVEWCEGNSKLKIENGLPARFARRAGEADKLEEDKKEIIETEVDSLSKKTANTQSTNEIALEEIQSRWGEILLGVRPKNYSIEALLRATRPVELVGQVITVEVFYKFHKDKLEDGKCRQIVEEVMSEVFKTPCSIRCVLGERPRITKNTETKSDYTEELVEPSHKPAVLVASNGGEQTNGGTSSNGETGDDLDIIKVAEEIFGSRAD